MKLIKRLFWPVVLILAVVGVALWLNRTRFMPTTTASAASGLTQVVTARQGNLSSNITVVGELDSLQRQDMTFSRMSTPAKLTVLDAKAGNKVKAGQKLAAIDPAPYQQALDQAKSDLQASQQKLADLKTPATKLAISQADLAVAKADLQIAQAQQALNDLVNPDMATLTSAVADAQRGLAQAQVSLASLQTDQTTADNLTKLRDTEAKTYTEYNRLASERTPASDQSYEDRLLVSYNAFKNAQDARVTAETQQQVNILKAQMQVNTAQKTLADAQTALATAQAGGDKLALAKAQVAVQAGQVTLSIAKDARATLDAGTDAATLAAAQADVDKKQLAVADAQADLTGTTLVAPFDGTVLQASAAVGNLIGATTQVLSVADMTALEVIASVDETTIQRVVAGQTAQVTFDAFPGQVFRGTVTSVPLQGALQGNVMVYQVPISLTGVQNLPLLVGMTANVQIQVGQVTNVVLVPTLALTRVNGMDAVLTPSADAAGQPVIVQVEIGLSDGVNSQIVRGLKAGDKVLVQYPASSTNNQNNRNGATQPQGGTQQFVAPAGGGGPQFIGPPPGQ